jgi:hypothetical protein
VEIDLIIEKLEYERRWNRMQAFAERGTTLGRFLSLRDDDQFVWLRERSDEPVSAQFMTAQFIVESSVRRLTATADALLDLDAMLACAIVEIRQYRIAPGMRARFATFLREKTLAEQLRLGMTIYGPFDDNADADVLTWLRGFPSLVERDRMKAAFYQGEHWLNDLQDEAFAMIEDYSNVMLVTPVTAAATA